MVEESKEPDNEMYDEIRTAAHEEKRTNLANHRNQIELAAEKVPAVTPQSLLPKYTHEKARLEEDKDDCQFTMPDIIAAHTTATGLIGDVIRVATCNYQTSFFTKPHKVADAIASFESGNYDFSNLTEISVSAHEAATAWSDFAASAEIAGISKERVARLKLIGPDPKALKTADADLLGEGDSTKRHLCTFILTTKEWIGRHNKTTTSAKGRIVTSTFHIPGYNSNKKLINIAYYGISGPQATDNKAAADELYLELIKIVEAARKAHHIVVLAGDTNCIYSQRDRDKDDSSTDATRPWYTRLEDMGLVDCWRHTRDSDAQGFTRLHMTEEGVTLSKGRLDQVWVDRANSYRVVQSHIRESDFTCTDHTHCFADIRLDGKLHLEASSSQRTGPITAKYTKEDMELYQKAAEASWGDGLVYAALEDVTNQRIEAYKRAKLGNQQANNTGSTNKHLQEAESQLDEALTSSYKFLTELMVTAAMQVPNFQPHKHDMQRKIKHTSPAVRLRKLLVNIERKMRQTASTLPPDQLKLKPALEDYLRETIAKGAELHTTINANTVRAWIRRIQNQQKKEQAKNRIQGIKEAIHKRESDFKTNRGLGNIIDRVLNRKGVKQPIIGVIYNSPKPPQPVQASSPTNDAQVAPPASTPPPPPPHQPKTTETNNKILSFAPADVAEHTTQVFENWAGDIDTIPQEPAFMSSRNPDDLHDISEEIQTILNLQTPRDAKIKPELVDIMEDINEGTVFEAIDHSPKRKAGGPSGVTPEMTVYLPRDIKAAYANLLIKVMESFVPGCIGEAQIFPIPKGDAPVPILDTTTKPEVRPITLCEPAFKQMERVLDRRTNQAKRIRNPITPLQHGFNMGLSSVDPAALMTLAVEDAVLNKKELHVIANDCSKAYDRVPYWVLRLCLEEYGYPDSYIDWYLRSLSTSPTRVLTSAGPGRWFTVPCGLGQGRVLSPHHWNVFLNPMLERLAKCKDAYRIGTAEAGVQLSAIAYADDTKLLASSYEGLKERLDIAAEYFRFTGMLFNPKKSHYITVNVHNPIPIAVGMDQIPSHTSGKAFKFMGYHFDFNEAGIDDKPEMEYIERKIEKILSAMTTKRISLKMTRYITHAVAHGVFQYHGRLYGSMEGKQRSVSKLDSLQARLAKGKAHLARTTTNHLVNAPSENHGLNFHSINSTGCAAIIQQTMEYIRVGHEQPGAKIAADAAVAHLTQINAKLELTREGWTRPTQALVAILQLHSSYYARFAQALVDSKLGISFPERYFTGKERTKQRHIDTHIANTEIPPPTVAALVKQGIFWVGQLTDPSGRYLVSTLLTQRSHLGIKLTDGQATHTIEALTHPTHAGPAGKRVGKYPVSCIPVAQRRHLIGTITTATTYTAGDIVLSGDNDNATPTGQLQYNNTFDTTTPRQEWMQVYEVTKGIQEIQEGPLRGQTYITVRPLIWNADATRGPTNTWMRPRWPEQLKELRTCKVLPSIAHGERQTPQTLDLSTDLVHKVSGQTIKKLRLPYAVGKMKRHRDGTTTEIFEMLSDDFHVTNVIQDIDTLRDGGGHLKAGPITLAQAVDICKEHRRLSNKGVPGTQGDGSEDECCVCGDASGTGGTTTGYLIRCDTEECRKVFHPQCKGLHPFMPDEEVEALHAKCPQCETKDKSTMSILQDALLHSFLHEANFTQEELQMLASCTHLQEKTRNELALMAPAPAPQDPDAEGNPPSKHQVGKLPQAQADDQDPLPRPTTHTWLAGDGSWHQRKADGTFSVITNNTTIHGHIPYSGRAGSSTHTEAWSIIFGMLHGLQLALKHNASIQAADNKKAPTPLHRFTQLQDNESSRTLLDHVQAGRYDGINGTRRVMNSSLAVELDIMRRLWSVAKPKLQFSTKWVTSHKENELGIDDQEKARRMANKAADLEADNAYNTTTSARNQEGISKLPPFSFPYILEPHSNQALPMPYYSNIRALRQQQALEAWLKMPSAEHLMVADQENWKTMINFRTNPAAHTFFLKLTQGLLPTGELLAERKSKHHIQDPPKCQSHSYLEALTSNNFTNDNQMQPAPAHGNQDVTCKHIDSVEHALSLHMPSMSNCGPNQALHSKEVFNTLCRHLHNTQYELYPPFLRQPDNPTDPERLEAVGRLIQENPLFTAKPFRNQITVTPRSHGKQSGSLRASWVYSLERTLRSHRRPETSTTPDNDTMRSILPRLMIQANEQLAKQPQHIQTAHTSLLKALIRESSTMTLCNPTLWTIHTGDYGSYAASYLAKPPGVQPQSAMETTMNQQRQTQEGCWYMAANTPLSHWIGLLGAHQNGATRMNIILVEPQLAQQQSGRAEEYKQLLELQATNGTHTVQQLTIPPGTIPYLTAEFYTGKSRSPLQQLPRNTKELTIYIVAPKTEQEHTKKTLTKIQHLVQTIQHAMTSDKPDMSLPTRIHWDLPNIFPEYASICPIIQDPGYRGLNKRTQWRFKTFDIMTHAGALHPKTIRSIQITLDCSIILKSTSTKLPDQAQTEAKQENNSTTFLTKISMETLEYSRRLFKATREVRAYTLDKLIPNRTKQHNYFSCLEDDETDQTSSTDTLTSSSPTGSDTHSTDTNTTYLYASAAAAPTTAPVSPNTTSTKALEAANSDSDKEQTDDSPRPKRRRKLQKASEIASRTNQGGTNTASATGTTNTTAENTSNQPQLKGHNRTTPATNTANYTRYHDTTPNWQAHPTVVNAPLGKRTAEQISNNDETEEARANLNQQHPTKKANTTDPGPGLKGSPQA